MKFLLAIETCHKFKSRADAQRKTWIPFIEKLGDRKFDYKFFLGKGERKEPLPDEVFLDVEDDYKGLPFKTREIARYAIKNGYDAIFKVDDDVYVFPDRLLGVLPTTPYEGRLNNSRHEFAPKGWCSGFSYWLNREALSIIANAPDPDHTAEDLWVGRILSKHGIACKLNSWFVVLSLYQKLHWASMRDRIITAAEFPDEKMFELHGIMMGKPVEPTTPQLNPGQQRIFELGKFSKVIRGPHARLKRLNDRDT